MSIKTKRKSRLEDTMLHIHVNQMIKNPGPGPRNTISQTDNKFLIVYRIIWEYLD